MLLVSKLQCKLQYNLVLNAVCKDYYLQHNTGLEINTCLTSYVPDFQYKTVTKRNLALYSVTVYAVIHEAQKI